MKEFLERVWNLTSSSSCVNSVLKGALKVPILTQLSAELCVMIKEFCTDWKDGGNIDTSESDHQLRPRSSRAYHSTEFSLMVRASVSKFL